MGGEESMVQSIEQIIYCLGVKFIIDVSVGPPSDHILA